MQNDLWPLWIEVTSVRSRCGELENSQKNNLYRLLNHIGNISTTVMIDIDGLSQDCSSTIANSLGLLKSCIKP